ncbi:hypothetical protein ABZ307_28420 [Streptomyces griseorubiginosus]|uniref:hypothetical protein n=1 Tax=Streptomyces griseorubiginosus TaxID=67304 RepID=UPI0033BF9093
MSVLNDRSAFRNAILGGVPVSKAVTLSAATLPAFTVAGGEVLITGLWLKVTTSITTDGGTVAVNNVPTAGNTVTLVTATDLGTTDTVAGSVVGVDRAATAAPSFLRGGRVDVNAVATTGVVNVVGASSVNGAAAIYVTWVPLTDGATLTAA